jgi:hypothetical protein
MCLHHRRCFVVCCFFFPLFLSVGVFCSFFFFVLLRVCLAPVFVSIGTWMSRVLLAATARIHVSSFFSAFLFPRRSPTSAARGSLWRALHTTSDTEVASHQRFQWLGPYQLIAAAVVRCFGVL